MNTSHVQTAFACLALVLACSRESGREVHAADNTAVNARDRDSGAPTPFDQKENEADLKVTQLVRQALMKDDALSFGAKNVKVITQEGVVTLRGVVASEDERQRVVSAAGAVAGVLRVDDQLDVEKP